jgi:hypothetical protein
MARAGASQPGAVSGADIARCRQAARSRLRQGLRAQRIFHELKAIVHFYNTRDVLPRCQPHDANEGAARWPAPESTDNMNTSRVGRLGLTDTEEDAIVSFMQTLTDGVMPVNQQ